MKVAEIWTALIVSMLVFCPHVLAQNPDNPIEDALLRWYPANQAVLFTNSACAAPQGLAFDGEHMWVACSSTNSAAQLWELNTSDGSLVRALTLTNVHPSYLLFDGANIWATDRTAGTLTEVRASDGSLVRPTMTLGTTPSGMAFDGRYIWIANSSTTSGSLTKVDATNGNTTPIDISAHCTDATNIAFVSSDPGSPAWGNLTKSIWVVCSATTPQVIELDPSNNNAFVTATPTIGGSPNCNNIAFDGVRLWFTTLDGPPPAGPSVIQVDTTNPQNMVVATSLTETSHPDAVAFDGEFIWVTDSVSSLVTKLFDGVTIRTAPAPGGNGYFVAFDGGNVWVSNSNGGSGFYVSKM